MTFGERGSDGEGEPRNSVSPDIYADDFSAAVDFFDTLPYVDLKSIGVIGICAVVSFARIQPASHSWRLNANVSVKPLLP